MALYLGTNKVKVNLNSVSYKVKILPLTGVEDSIRLLSSDRYILKDANGVYLTTKEVE